VTVFHCFASPASVRIPSNVGDIDDYVFAGVASLVALSFDEGILRIGESSFSGCSFLQTIAFPASLLVIESYAFYDCDEITSIAFAPGTNLLRMGNTVFTSGSLASVAMPETVKIMHPFAFPQDVWAISRLADVAVAGDFLLSADLTTLLVDLEWHNTVNIPEHIEVIGVQAFDHSDPCEVVFANGSRLREIEDAAFFSCSDLRGLAVPASVEIIGDRCFQNCSRLCRVTFEGISRLRRIGGLAFSGCNIDAITIPASTRECDGSAFLGCPLIEMHVEPGSVNFAVSGNFLTTADGREIVKCFGFEREVIVPKTVEVLGRSSFEACTHIERVVFENGSNLRRIAPSALSGCESLTDIEIPASVEIIEEVAFRKCHGLEQCLIGEDGNLRMIQPDAFAECHTLRSFNLPRGIQVVGNNCFQKCGSLFRLGFGSGESLMKIVGDAPLDEALEQLGFRDIASAFRIEVQQGGSELNFPGWVLVDDGSGHLTFIQGIQ
jgi:hypothetical protein